jgi:transposase
MQGLIHISDPMARAVRLVREGKSQRLAASLCGVSRTSLQRALNR